MESLFQQAAKDAQNPEQQSQPTIASVAPTSGTSTGMAAMFEAAAQQSQQSQQAEQSNQPHDLTPEEYSALPADQQRTYDEHVREGRSVFDPATGFIKGVGQTVNTLSGLMSRVAPSVVRPSDVAGLKQIETPSNPMQQAGNIGEGVAEFFLGDEALKAFSVAERLGMAAKVAKLAESHPVIARIIGHGLTAVRGGTVTVGQQLAHGASPSDALRTGAEATALGTGLGAAVEGAGAVKNAVSEAENPNLVRQILKGKEVAQPGAQSAVRRGVQASTEAAGTADVSIATNIENQPLLKGNQSVLDEPLSVLKENEATAYKKVDDTVGFDLKAEKAQLANDKYKLSQLGNTDADVTARGNLIEAINDSEDRIVEAEQKLKDAGIDPKQADAIHQQRMAGSDFKKVLVKNTNADGSVNVDGLLKDSKNLRFNKYGDRLSQFMGKEAADDYVTQLQKMQELGAHAVTARKVALWLGGVAGVGAIGHGAVSAIAHVVP